MSLTPGRKLGPYEILASLGAGGMAEVYRALDPKLGREVAIKVLREELASDPDRLRRLEQEARAASALNHPNIITIHDIAEEGSTRYIVMEYVEGKTLREMFDGRPLRTKMMLGLATQIADGLAKAHSAGIVHRDLKPENLMVTDDGFVKILDFGLARVKSRLPTKETASQRPTVSRHTSPGTVLGTAGYMSPEQAKGLAADFRSDQFSLGAILYEMATGKRAFYRDTPVQTLSAIIESEPDSLVSLNPNLPPHFRAIVERCLAKEAAERFASTLDLARDLESIRDYSSQEQPQPTSVIQPDIRGRRIRTAALAGAVVGVLVLAVGLNMGGLRDRLIGEPGPSRIESVAVLPLENLSDDPEQEFFADGMTDALTSDLAKLHALRVISRTSAMRSKRNDKPLPEIGAELNVDAVVEGSVLRVGQRVRITAQLIHAATDTHLWAESYERDLQDVLVLQSEVAQAIAREIEIAVTPEEEARLAARRVVNPETYEAYLKGRYHWNKRDAEGFRKGIKYFREAIDADPNFAPPYAGLADSYALLSSSFDLLPPGQAQPKARTFAERALAIDPDLAEAYASLGVVRFAFDWDWSGASEALQRAIDLNPSYATAYHWYALHLANLGRFETAFAQMKRARELDPLSLIINTELGRLFYTARRYDEATEQLQHTLEMDRDFVPARIWLAVVYLQRKMYQEAIETSQAVATIENGGPTALALLGASYAAAGKTRDATAILEKLKEVSAQRYVPPVGIAVVHGNLGDLDEAFAWLEKAFEERSAYLRLLKVDPVFDPLRSDPRFQDLLRRMNFPG